MTQKQILCGAALTMASAMMFASEPVQPGSRWSYKEPSGRELCVTVVVVDTGPDAEPWAWFTFDGDPRRTVHMPVSMLHGPCKSKAT